MKKRFKALLALLRLGGVLTALKAVEGPLYYGVFASIVHSDGMMGGSIKILYIHLFLFYPVWLLYNALGKDAIGIVAVKESVSRGLAKLRGWAILVLTFLGIYALVSRIRAGASGLRLPPWKWLRWIKWLLRLLVVALVWLAEFLFCTWQFDPFVTILFVRRHGRKMPFVVEAVLIFASSCISTAWWTMVWGGVIASFRHL